MRVRPFTIALALAAPACIFFTLRAQGPMGPAPVRFTEVVNREVRAEVTLSGSVEARTSSMVASEVAGRVERIVAREGDLVRRGGPLATLRSTNLELQRRALAGQLKEAEARIKLARRNLERMEDLLESEVVSQGDYDDAVSEFVAWEGRIDTLRAEIERVDVDLERCTVRAPFDGAVVAERAEVGEWIDVGDPVTEVVALGELDVRIEVPEQYFPRLRQGVAAAVSFESLPGMDVPGRVVAIIPRADPQARTFPVKVRIRDDTGRLGVGMLARVRMPLGEPYPALLVPKDAVVDQGPRRIVFKMNGDETVSSVGVQVGMGLGPWVIVEGPLAAGERVITRGNERLQPGQPVQGTPLEYELPAQ